MPPEEAVKRIGMTVEGCIAARTALELAKENGVSMPITEQLCLVLDGKSPREALRDLMGRPSRHENERVWLEGE